MTRPDSQGIDDAVARFLDSFCSPGALLVAVSGGGDSVCLLVALDAALRSGRHVGFSLVACTIDHALREGSADEARWVAELCARRGIAHVTRRWEGAKPTSGIQAAAREARHAYLAEVAREIGAAAIVTAHNLDDQRETIAMRSMRRGAGAGLAGIAPATLVRGSAWVLRPLLAVPRADIRAHLRTIGQDWLDDPSNVDRRFERVRVRHDGAEPDAGAGPDADRALHVAGAAAAAARLEVACRGAAFITSEVRVVDASAGVLPPAAIATALAEPPAWRALLALAAVLGGREHLPDAAGADRLRDFIESGALSRKTVGRVVFDRRREGLFVYREQRGIDAITIAPHGEATWDGRWRVLNRGATALTVRAAAGEGDGLPGLHGVPAGVAARSARSRPRVLAAGFMADARSFALEPLLSPYERYLPVFELPLANALARLFGRKAFPPPPNARAEDEDSCDLR
ncbi:tRNA lysidine(34) synthetase TilS [Mycoplana dimorpha]|uniref:tRNA(Ile)-lysidine synthase n=1 Tax=Mycoplana dimorpha TaxID=28320 RepID=A0A2T5B615_MYCDI|nr:tRNA lysidine(34) synthetase TilS [Mycoplana dimorpha]PTM94436.1 tRNA(Ile)-lysidine synthase [Mycoplana dimorpha]